MRHDDIKNMQKRKGTETKLLSVMIVALFLASSVCSIFSESVNADTADIETKNFTPDWSEIGKDSPVPDLEATVNKSANFVTRPAESLELLNQCAISGESSWNEETKTLYLTSMKFISKCEGEDNGAILTLPAGSTIVLQGNAEFYGSLTPLYKTSYGVYCDGDLSIHTGGYMVFFSSGKIENTEGSSHIQFSAGMYVKGTLTVDGEKKGRIVSIGAPSTYTEVFGIHANKFVLNNTEMDCQSKNGRFFSTGLYADTIEINCTNNEKVTVAAGGGVYGIDGTESIGIKCNNLEIINGIVQTVGGSDDVLFKSCGIVIDDGTISGNGTLCASGGVSAMKSAGLETGRLTIDIPYLYTSAVYSKELNCIYSNELTIRNCHVDCTLGRMADVDSVYLFKVKSYFSAENSEINCKIECGVQVFGMDIKEGDIENCKLTIDIPRNPFVNNVLSYPLNTGDNVTFKNSTVYIKASESRFNTVGIRASGNYGSYLVFENCKVYVETGDYIGMGDVPTNGIQAEGLKILNTEMYVKCGRSNDYSTAIDIGGDNSSGLIIENSKVVAISGDIVNESTNDKCSTHALIADKGVTITNSDVKLIGGHVTKENDVSSGIAISHDSTVTIALNNSRFVCYGETESISLYRDAKFDFICSEKLYGVNKETLAIEEFEMKDLNKYSAIVTEQTLPKEEDNTPLIIGLFAVVLVSLFITAIFVRK